MLKDFPDYDRGPGFWFHFQMLLAADVCAHPILSAKNSDFKAEVGDDMYKMIDEGLRSYERVYKYRYITEW